MCGSSTKYRIVFLIEKIDYFYISIDIIYIRDNKVTTVIQNAQPATSTNMPIFQPTEKSDKVLEVNAGESKEHNIKAGSSVEFKNL